MWGAVVGDIAGSRFEGTLRDTALMRSRREEPCV